MLNNKELQDLTGFYVNWHGISAVLSTYFFLITKCLSVLLTNSADSLSNIGKTLYIVKRKICVLELRYFMPDIETC